MNMCANHPQLAAVAYCRSCGKPLCEECRVESMGAIYCAEHAPAAHPAGPPPLPQYVPGPSLGAFASDAPASPYTAPKRGGSLFWAVVLGMIPGVGAIYNGQYAKGLIHAVVFGLLITIVSGNGQELAPLVGILIAVWWFYMVLESYHTARKQRDGLPVDEFSSILHLHGNQSAIPVGAVVLIGLGALLLLDTTGLIPMERLIRYWPAGLILLGVYMLYARTSSRTVVVDAPEFSAREFSDERR